MNTDPVYLSKKGLLKLEQELKQLKTVDRPEIIAEIKRTMELGDLSENAEYHAAKEAQTHIERKIAELEDKLSRAREIDTDKIPSDKAYIFAKVLVKDLKRDDEIEYQLVPPDEADVDNDMISVKSPVGAALLGKEVGDTIEIKVPAGILQYEIMKISRDE
ncbi:MAG: transcription elongation factor GreA [candidate division Zixibacteria bacterium]|nr:transcription elongation factor GreA [candidate division Zixibacteria bacterium]